VKAAPTAAPAGLERRRSGRTPVPASGGPVSVVGARLHDLSPLGMMIESPVAIAVDTELPFRLIVEGQKADVHARVAACTPLPGGRRAFGIGLEFTRIDDAVRGRLAHVLTGART
jgi:hypothetical protein